MIKEGGRSQRRSDWVHLELYFITFPNFFTKLHIQEHNNKYFKCRRSELVYSNYTSRYDFMFLLDCYSFGWTIHK